MIGSQLACSRAQREQDGLGAVLVSTHPSAPVSLERCRPRRAKRPRSGGGTIRPTLSSPDAWIIACVFVIVLTRCGEGFMRRGTPTSPCLGRHRQQQWGWHVPSFLHGEIAPQAHYYAWRIQVFALRMGKGDGKTRKPKKKAVAAEPPPLRHSVASSGAAASSSSASSASSSSPPPRRVSNNINIPVRKQILMAQINKQLQQSAESGSFRQRRKLERTSYRRTWDEDEMLEKAEERRKRGQEPNWDVILSRNATLPLVIVDGYNIIYKWSRLKKHMIKGDLMRARQLLVDDLENLSSLKGWRIEVVFDGSHRRRQSMVSSSSAGAALSAAMGPSATTNIAERASTKQVSKHGVRVVYTGAGVEADSYIEARCAEAKNVTSGRLTSSFLVATDDQMVRMAGLNAGALCMGAERFVTELKAVRQSVAYRVEAAVAAANGHHMRPDLLRKTPTAASASSAVLSRRFGRGSVVIEDKRKRKEEMKRNRNMIPDLDIKIEVEVDENGIPWWAKVPNHTYAYKH